MKLILMKLSKTLIQCGYERVEMVEGKGQFSLRGGILDYFLPIQLIHIELNFLVMK